MGPTAEAMLQALRNEGLVITLDHAELPDRASQFLHERLAWLSDFGALIAEEAHQPFYSALGSLLSRFIAGELTPRD